MARPLAPCGTYSAYKRHRRLGEEVDPACERARDERTAADAAARKKTRAQARAAAAPAPPPTDDEESDWDASDLISRIRGERSLRDYRDPVQKTRAERLQWNLDLVEAAMAITVASDAAKLAPLSKRHSELLDELHRIDGDKPVKDPLDEFFGDGGSNVVGISTASSRKQA